MEKINKEQAEKACKNSYSNYLIIAAISAVFLLPGIASASPIAPETLIGLTNKERAAHGLEPLSYNAVLAQAAEEKAKAVLQSQKFEHNIDGKRFSSWVREAGYAYDFVGENLAIDFETSEGVTKAWMDSETHKKNILNPRYTEIGISAVAGAFQNEDTIVVAEIFASPLAAFEQPARAVPAAEKKSALAIADGKISEGAFILSIKTKSFLRMFKRGFNKIPAKLSRYGLIDKADGFLHSRQAILFFDSFEYASLVFLDISVAVFYAFALPSVLYGAYSKRIGIFA